MSILMPYFEFMLHRRRSANSLAKMHISDVYHEIGLTETWLTSWVGSEAYRDGKITEEELVRFFLNRADV